MIVVMKFKAAPGEVERVISKVHESGLKTHFRLEPNEPSSGSSVMKDSLMWIK